MLFVHKVKIQKCFVRELTRCLPGNRLDWPGRGMEPATKPSTGVSTRRSSALHVTPAPQSRMIPPSTVLTPRTAASHPSTPTTAQLTTDELRSAREITLKDSDEEGPPPVAIRGGAGPSPVKALNKTDLVRSLSQGATPDDSMDHTEQSNSEGEEDNPTSLATNARGEGEELGSEEASEDEESESDSEEEDEDGDDNGSIETRSIRPPASSSRPSSPRQHQRHPLASTGDVIMINGTASTSADPALNTTTTNSMDPPPITELTARKRAPRAPRYRSPTPPPIRPYVPPPTVRLEIILPDRRADDDDDVPEFIISDMIASAGYNLAQPEEEDRVEGEGSKLVDNSAVITRTATGEVVSNPIIVSNVPAVRPILACSDLRRKYSFSFSLYTQKRQRTRKRLGRDDGYNVEDPFVDDSELEVFEVRLFHAPSG